MAYLLVLLAVVCRLIPHPPNFAPVLAVALLGGATLPPAVAVAVPLAALILSDLALSYPITWMNLVVYGCFLAGVGLGRWLTGQASWGRRIAAALTGSVFFYVVTNFAVWLTPPFMYERSAAGLFRCYVMALPFFRNSLAGDLFWTASLFGLHDVAKVWAGSRRSRLRRATP